MYNAGMKHIGAELRKAVVRTRETERGELMRYFCRQLNIGRVRDNLPAVTMGRMGKLLQKIPTKDLYYLKRICDDSSNFSKKFWYEINPEMHTPAAVAERQSKFARKPSR